MDRQVSSAAVGLASAAIGTALFVYGVLFVVDPVGIFGLLLTVGGVVVTIASAVRARGRAGATAVAIVATLLLAFIGWVLWALATQTR